MTRNTTLTCIVAALLALAGCQGTSPTEPGLPEGTTASADLLNLTVVDSLVTGHEELDLSFLALVPAIDQETEADSLLVTVTDLLTGTSLSTSAWGTPLFSESGSGGDLQEGEEAEWKGKIKTKTKKIKYSDGSSVYRTEIETRDFSARGRQSGAECRSNEAFNFSGDNPGGATTFTQIAHQVVVCPGTGREFLLHITLHFTVTPNGKTSSSVSNVKTKGPSGGS